MIKSFVDKATQEDEFSVRGFGEIILPQLSHRTVSKILEANNYTDIIMKEDC